MRAVIQRTSEASVVVSNETVAQIGIGLLILLGISRRDTEAAADYLAHRIPRLRIFEDSERKMNRDVSEVGGSLIVVPNFTLYGDCVKGRRPSFDMAARPDSAEALFEYFCERLATSGVLTQRGVFRANMKVNLINNGPVTLVIDSP